MRKTEEENKRKWREEEIQKEKDIQKERNVQKERERERGRKTDRDSLEEIKKKHVRDAAHLKGSNCQKSL